MATRHEITSIQFKADAGKANAAIDSIRQKAKEANDQMAQLRQKLEEGKKANLPIEDLKKMEDQLKSATKEAKQWSDAQRNLMRGVKALDEAIIQFNRGQGSVEKMSAALSKAARNAAQLQQSRMERGSQGWQEMEALITALDKNLVKARQDFDGLVQTIEAGGRVSVSELTSAKQSLKELSDLTAYGSDEWKGYQAQLDAVTKRFDSLSQTEKRLAGEIVTVEDARKRAAAADADEARRREILAESSKQQATALREYAEGTLQIAKTNMAWFERVIARTKEQLAAQQQLVGSFEALEDAESQAMSKTMAAETALQKQREETNRFSDAAWEAAKKVVELETKLKELEAQGSTPKSNPTLEKLKQDIESTTDELGQLESQWQDKITDYIYEKYPTQATVSAKTKSPEGLKEREAMKNDPVLAKMREQSKQELDAVDQKLMQLIRQERELAEATKEETAATQSSADIDKQKAELQKQLTEAQQKLADAKAAAEGPTKKLKEAEEAYTEAQRKEQEATESLDKVRGNMNLGEEQQKLEALERQHDDLTESLQKQKQREQELAQDVAAYRQKEQDAVIELAQAQNQSEESLKRSVEVLEQQNKTLEAGSDEWMENEQAIGKLNKRIEELKQQSQELRGEVMSLAEAEELADKAMEEQALTTKTGWAASTEELKRAEQTLAEEVAKAKRGTAEEEAAYQKLVRQLQAVRTELGAGSMSGKQMMDVLSNPKNVTSVDTLKAAIGRARQELDALGRRIDQAKQSGQSGEVKKLQKVYDDLAKSVQQTDIRMKELQNSSKGTASAFDKAWSRLKTYVGLYVGAAVAMQKLTAAMGDLMELSDKMGEVRKTTGFTADEVGRLSENLAKLDTRTTLTQLMELSSLAGSVGLKTQEQVQGFTEAADQLIVALPELGNESARTIIKIANATGDLEKNGGNVRETLEKVGSTIIALRANSASAAGPITDFVSRVGAVGAQAGISIDQIAALGSTIDALGGRVEMSATALSRMIPAIKNNSFAIANSIGVTEKYLKSLAPMEQMVLIFQKMRDNIQHIDTSTEEGMNAMADNVEAMLGKNATMREVMKDLEQQGARAGIVFGLLSQNVDELQKQLGIASEAYRENTALANEFNNMNETTAAKWERLKNKVEEMFVGDQAQRWLGTIIDWLRKIVDFIAEDGPIVQGLKLIAVYAAAMKMELGAAFVSAGDAFRNLGVAIAAGVNHLGIFARATAAARVEWEKMDVAMKANIWGAVIAALGAIAFKLWDMHKAAKEAATEVGRFNQTIADEKKALDDLFAPLNKSNLSQQERSRLISEINSKYSRYLGFMLSETNRAIQLADAHALIAKRIREEAYEKRILEQEDKVRNRHNEDVNAAYGNIEEQVRKGRRGNADVSEVSDILKSVIDRNLGNISGVKNAGDLGDNRYVELSAAAREDLNNTIEALVQNGKISRQNATLITGAVMKYAIEAKEQYDDMQNATASTRADLRNVQRSIRGDVNAGLNGLVNRLKNFGQTSTPTTPLAVTQRQSVWKSFRWGKQENGETPDWVWDPTKRSQQQVQMPLLDWKPNIDKKNIEQVKRYVEAQDQLRSYLEANAGRIDEQTRKTAEMYLESEESMKELRSLIPSGSGGGSGFGGSGGGGGTNPYGTYNRVTSPYQDWDADALVSRRKEMLERVRALANGADVQAVLSEDAKFITEATRNNIKTTKQAIEWYNTERLKIQDALHEKHLTNTGDWMDPTKQKARAKVIKDEWSAYLNELDAYYTERKAKIQEQQNDEEISEAEARNRTLANEAEWRQRRAELQKLYARKSAEVTDEEQQAIFDIISERTGDSADFIQKTIGKTVKFIYDIGQKSEAEQRTIFGKLDKGIEQDLLRQRNAIGQHMKDITAIINKENPYAGITEELRKNLGTMDALLTDIEKDEERTVEKEIERTMFILEQSTKGYALTWEELMREMAKRGWQAWADAVNGDTQTQERLMHQVYRVFEKVQDAIKKEASQLKKDADIMWSNILLPGGDGKTTIKDAFEQTIGALGIEEGRVSRANSLIGAGQASERVADRLAIQQMKVQLAMQQYQYSLVRKIGNEKIESLKKEAAENEAIGDIEKARQLRMQAQNAEMALNLATRKEQTEELKQQEAIIAKTEESEARLYKELREWADLLTSSLQSVFEATHAGDAEYYNELAKLNLTGKGGPGAGTYIVIDNEGTSDATAHYEYLDEREALERQHEIERENAMADAWKKVMDDINMKMSETITDQLNAMLQNASLDANTQAVLANTEALYATSGRSGGADMGIGADGIPNALRPPMEGENSSAVGGSPTGMNGYAAPWQQQPQGEQSNWQVPMASPEVDAESYTAPWAAFADASKQATQTTVANNKKIAASSQSMFAKMTMAANMYGIAYQAMSNDNLSTTQKFEMMALQAVGNYAIGALTTEMAAASAKAATDSPGVLGKLWKELGWAAAPVFAIFTGLLGGLMGLASSKIGKAKSTIAQATGASSASAGRLSTGMLTYAEGNVNEFTDPSSLTPGKRYNVDAADGKTYRARYMGRNPKTHLTNGPEFHLSGERGREMIIDAGTTRQITMNEGEIWHAIQTLSGGGSARRFARRGRGIPAFADGNIEDFMDGSVPGDSVAGMSGMSAEQAASLQASIDRQSDLLEDLRINGIKATFDVYGKGGLVDSYDSGKKTLNRYGERY